LKVSHSQIDRNAIINTLYKLLQLYYYNCIISSIIKINNKRVIHLNGKEVYKH